ncbi:MAG: hypothetical protein GY711_17955 [bacterium]|nr:hypothetical protein [bacterium]
MAAPVAAQVVHTESDVIGPAGQFQDFFGEDLATSGGLLLAGVRNADNPAGVSSGGAFLYANDGKRWHEVQRLWPPDGGQADQFGNAVALSGSTAAVGSWFDDDLGHDSGSVYVYERTSSGWTETQRLLPIDYDVPCRFGSSVALDGDTLLVGAPGRVNGSGHPVGAIYVFERGPSGWQQTGLLKPPVAPTSTSGGFGGPVDLDGDIAVAGASSDSHNAPLWSGAAYVFERGGAGWAQTAFLTAPFRRREEVFGTSVSVSGTRIAIGTPWMYGGQFQPPAYGSVFVFRRQGGQWIVETRLYPQNSTDDDRCGFSVDLQGDRLAVGGYWALEQGLRAGATFLFERTPIGWVERLELVSEEPVHADALGTACALDGHWILGGALAGQVDGIRSGTILAFEQPFGTSYCPGAMNSTGVAGELFLTGSRDALDRHLGLRARHLPPGSFGLFLVSDTGSAPSGPGGQGTLCLGGPIGRFQSCVEAASDAGRSACDIDTTHLPFTPSRSIASGDTWHFQMWYRDAGGLENYTNAVRVRFG